MPKGIPRDKSVKRELLHHLKIARGHLDKVIEMTEAGEYCIDIIHQSQAVQSSLKNIDRRILQNHMQTCVAESIKKGKTKEVIEEVMQIIKKT